MALIRKDNDKIEDFGEKIGGARKDLWKERGLNLDDFEGLDEREYSQFITKANIWPTPDFKSLIENGMEQGCAYYVKFVRDKLPAKPVSNSKEHARIYIGLVTIYKTVLLKLKSNDELLHTNILSKLEAEAASQDFKYLRVRPYYNVIKSILLYDYQLKRLITEAELQGFPEFSGALKGLTIAEYTSMGSPVIRLIQGKHYASPKTFTNYEDAIKYAKEELIPELLEKKTTKRETRTKSVVRPQLAHIERTGANVRKGKDITGDDLIDEFKFRGGEFGNWNTQDDRQACLNYAYEAFRDLASVLRAPTEFISLGGYKDKKLAIAFGARGKGSAIAHYEPTNVVINLTKMKGAGSLAHEWAHALDDYLGIKCADRSMLSSVYISRSKTDLQYPEVANAFDSLIDSMRKRPATYDEIKESVDKDVERYKKRIDYEISRLHNFYGSTVDQSATIQEAVNNFKKSYTQEAFDELVSIYKEIVGRLPSKETRDNVGNLIRFLGYSLEALSKLESIENPDDLNEDNYGSIPSLDTNFYTASKELDKYRAKPYFQNKEEMFARAFESYIEDVIKNRGNKSDYLVHSTSNEFYGELFPYPQGDERKLINQKIKEFLLLVVETFAEVEEDVKEVDEVVGETAEEKSKFKLTYFKNLCKDNGLKVDFGKSPINNEIYTINFTEGYVSFINVPVFNDITQDGHNINIYCGEKGGTKYGYGWDKELDYEDLVKTLLKLESEGKKEVENTEEKFQLTNFKELCRQYDLKVDFGTTPEENGNYIINFKKGFISYIETKIMLDTKAKGQLITIYTTVAGMEVVGYTWNGALNYEKLVKRLVSLEKDLGEKDTANKEADKAKDVLDYNKLDTPNELSPIEKEFQSMMVAAEKIRDLAKSKGLRVKLNEEDATITLYHGTSKENANKIKRTGFNPQTHFSHAKTKTGYQDEGPMYYAKTKHKNGEILVIHADARAIQFIEKTGGLYAPKGLIFKGGVWKEREENRLIETPTPPESQKSAQKEIKPQVAKGIKEAKELRNILNDYVGQLNIKTPYTATFGHILAVLQYNLTVKYQINIPIIRRVIPEDKVQGNSKVWAYDVNYNLNIQKSAEDRKKAEGVIEGIVEGLLAKSGYTGLKRSMLREGLTHMICKTYNLDVRTYLTGPGFDRTIKAGDTNVNNYITQLVELYKNYIKYFIQ